MDQIRDSVPEDGQREGGQEPHEASQSRQGVVPAGPRRPVLGQDDRRGGRRDENAFHVGHRRPLAPHLRGKFDHVK